MVTAKLGERGFPTVDGDVMEELRLEDELNYRKYMRKNTEIFTPFYDLT